jgi:capsule polysaccharide export protein KpsE/RkpR
LAVLEIEVVEHAARRTVETKEDGLVLTRVLETETASQVDSPILAISRLLWTEGVRLRKAVIVGALLTLIISLLIPNSYEATVHLMPPDNSSLTSMAMLGAMGDSGSGGGGMSGLAGSIGELLGGQRPGALFVGVLGSDTIEDRIIDRFDLRKVYWRGTYLDTRKKLESNTDISEDRKTGIIEITVSDHDAARAAAMAQAYVDELNRLLAQVNTSSASRERVFLEQRLTVVHTELQQAAKELSEFSSKNTTLDPEAQGKAMVEAAAALQGQLIAAQSELSGLEQIYTSENARVRALKANIGKMEQQLNKLGGKDYAGATTLDPHTLYPSIRQLPVLALQYAELYRRVKIDETVFELLTKTYELAKVQEAKETPSVKVLDPAKMPEKKSWPPRTLLTLIGALIGFIVGGAWIVAKEFWVELDANEPNKKFIQDIWAESKPFLVDQKSRLLSRLPRFHSRNGNFNPPEGGH